MKILSALALFVIIVVGAAGCQSQRGVVGADDVRSDSSTIPYTDAIHVLVDGRDQGTIPRTIRVRRSFGTRVVSLWQYGEEIRIYELSMSPTTSGNQTRMGFWGSNTADGETYDVRTLPNEDETYEIPFSNGPMKIEDNEYGLTMLIRE